MWQNIYRPKQESSCNEWRAGGKLSCVWSYMNWKILITALSGRPAQCPCSCAIHRAQLKVKKLRQELFEAAPLWSCPMVAAATAAAACNEIEWWCGSQQEYKHTHTIVDVALVQTDYINIYVYMANRTRANRLCIDTGHILNLKLRASSSVIKCGWWWRGNRLDTLHGEAVKNSATK